MRACYILARRTLFTGQREREREREERERESGREKGREGEKVFISKRNDGCLGTI